MEAIIAIAIFAISYLFLLLEKINRALVALCGAALLIVFNIFTIDDAMTSYVDWSTIVLLFSMMVLITITQRTGIFEFIALWLIKRIGERPYALFFWIAVLTAVGSALLDNVTTVLLFVPILIHMIRELNLPAFPYLVMVIISSNIGGTATMIGDPPNIMIGQAVEHLTFMSFIVHLAPIVVIIFLMTMGLLFLFFNRSLKQVETENNRSVRNVDPKSALKHTPLLYQSVSILCLTIIAFMFHGLLHVELTTIALVSALLLLLLSEKDGLTDIVFSKIEWTTLFFFIGLFILVGGLEQTGIIDHLAVMFMSITEGESLKSSYAILWSAGLLSGFLDNIPYVASMIQVLLELEEFGMKATDPMWWALALGACLGGNSTLLGASANVVVAGIASTNGVRIPFLRYMVYGFTVVLLSLLIASGYLYIRYF
ncbi:ArsB/NhaD family transporter [Alkalibacillus salilacus]|uniref:Na+/H+ antiporter NhaD/arsenite permease-like protein n=1 Tax=Alkalibacillus salilacus TaxID=284582 RepID=A0ABT9VCZ8_9BACI|nr:ArsB/NhaD family transporter [Alkalibacillus salilacus]MDQ0158735.1 Na+/H+ antiporter NhaD/arsenite permease-like protein [Alkalibacillus salilacus]